MPNWVGGGSCPVELAKMFFNELRVRGWQSILVGNREAVACLHFRINDLLPHTWSSYPKVVLQ